MAQQAAASAHECRDQHSRPQFLRTGTATGTGLLLAGITAATRGDETKEESGRRLNNKQDLEPSILAGATKIVRTFIEDYHEKLEEDHLFPRFEKWKTPGRLDAAGRIGRCTADRARRTGEVEEWRRDPASPRTKRRSSPTHHMAMCDGARRGPGRAPPTPGPDVASPSSPPRRLGPNVLEQTPSNRTQVLCRTSKLSNLG